MRCESFGVIKGTHISNFRRLHIGISEFQARPAASAADRPLLCKLQFTVKILGYFLQTFRPIYDRHTLYLCLVFYLISINLVLKLVVI